MHKKIIKAINATIINIIVALFFVGIIIGAIYLSFGAKIEECISLINIISVDTNKKEISETTINEENRIQNYPEYGTQYATIEIPAIDVELPVIMGTH